MLGVNIKAFDEDDNEERIRVRVSPVGYEQLIKYLRSIGWDGVLKEEQELFPEGLSDEERLTHARAHARTEDYEAALAG